MKGQLSMLDRTMLGYAGVSASQVADIERVTVEAVHDSRRRLSRRPEDGHRASPHYEQALTHAKRARYLQRARADTDAQAAWGEANLQASLAILDTLAELEHEMRTNRSPML